MKRKLKIMLKSGKTRYLFIFRKKFNVIPGIAFNTTKFFNLSNYLLFRNGKQVLFLFKTIVELL